MRDLNQRKAPPLSAPTDPQDRLDLLPHPDVRAQPHAERTLGVAHLSPIVSRPDATAFGRWRRPARLLISSLFVAALGAAVFFTLLPRGGEARRYPPNPVAAGRSKVAGLAPAVPLSNRLSKTRSTSLSALAARLPGGVLRRLPTGAWLLTQPVSIRANAVLAVDGGSLDIARGAFLETTDGGAIRLTNMRITGVDDRGRPLRRPGADRGFIVARNGATLWLQHDTIRYLGHLGVTSYGISFRKPGRPSGVVDSTVDGNYFGVYMSHADGVQINRNRVLNSRVYGIDPHTESSNISIRQNYVADSGIHGIVLADRVRDSDIRWNRITRSRLHGIVVYDNSTGNLIRSNHVSNTFDGIVLTNSLRNRVVGNVVTTAERFGLRLTSADNNVVEHNLFANALLGVYLYDGTSGNVLRDNTFRGNTQNLRIRADAPDNRVSPIPPQSEIE